MTHLDIEVTEAEYKTRKYWLILLILCHFLAPALLLLTLTPASFLTLSTLEKELTASIILGSLFSFWIFYRCTYKKFGTRWITFALVMNVLMMIRTILQILHFPGLLPSLFHILDLALLFWWHILSLRLLRLNQKIRTHLHTPTTQ